MEFSGRQPAATDRCAGAGCKITANAVGQLPASRGGRAGPSAEPRFSDPGHSPSYHPVPVSRAGGSAPAKDLERFAEVGYKNVLDADATPGTLEDGKHRVFIEFARTPAVVGQIIAFLEDLKKLTNIKTLKAK